jgi:Tfp pilus assembly protein PilZ
MPAGAMEGRDNRSSSMEKFDILRRIGRLAPRHVARAAVFRDSQQLGFGVLTNLSMTGACIATDTQLGLGSDVDLTLSFYRQPCLYELAASVVWSRPGGAGEKGLDGLQLHGVRFTSSSALERLRLHALLADEGFVHVFHPSATEFDFLRNALAGEFDELGSKIQKTTGAKS